MMLEAKEMRTDSVTMGKRKNGDVHLDKSDRLVLATATKTLPRAPLRRCIPVAHPKVPVWALNDCQVLTQPQVNIDHCGYGKLY
jgi:hypothetical protein